MDEQCTVWWFSKLKNVMQIWNTLIRLPGMRELFACLFSDLRYFISINIRIAFVILNPLSCTLLAPLTKIVNILYFHQSEIIISIFFFFRRLRDLVVTKPLYESARPGSIPCPGSQWTVLPAVHPSYSVWSINGRLRRLEEGKLLSSTHQTGPALGQWFLIHHGSNDHCNRNKLRGQAQN